MALILKQIHITTDILKKKNYGIVKKISMIKILKPKILNIKDHILKIKFRKTLKEIHKTVFIQIVIVNINQENITQLKRKIYFGINIIIIKSNNMILTHNLMIF